MRALSRSRQTALALALALGLSGLAPCPVQAQQDAAADARRTPVVRVVQEAGPAVVSIVSAREVKAPFAGESMLQRFFGEGQAPAPKSKTAQGLGSGVIIDGRKGYVLTNAHVITGATQITARLQDGREFQAALQGADQDMDRPCCAWSCPRASRPCPRCAWATPPGS